MSHKIIGSIGLAACVSILGFASEASAACPATAAIFIFDQSASMNDAGSTGAPKKDIALAKALNDYKLLPTNVPLGVMGFGNAPPVGSEPYTATYIDLAGGFTKASNNAALTAAINSASVPGNFNTPLAGGVCDAIDAVLTANPECLFETVRQLYVYSDGLENSTPTTHACYSSFSSSLPFNPAGEDTGFGLEDNSWEWKVANKAWTGIPDLEDSAGGTFPHIVTNVTLLFDFVNSLASNDADAFDGLPQGADLQSVNANGVAFFSGLAVSTNGSYFEAKKINGVATKMPVPGDTDPTPTYSCVNQADTNRVLQAQGRTVRSGDPNFSEEDLAKRDVNNDLKINSLDYQVVLANYGKCS